MGGFRNEQRRLDHRGRVFQFVSYEAQAGNPAKNQPPMPATWYLTSYGNRWPAIPLQEGLPGEALDALLAEWLESHVFANAR